MGKSKDKKPRRPRDTSYSVTQQLIKEFGVERLKEIYMENNGIYGSAEYLSKIWSEGYVHYTVTYTLARKFNWQRLITNKDCALARSVLSGKVPIEYYKHVIFSEDILNEVKKNEIL